MAYFFNGRLITTPAVVSQVDDSAMDNPNPNVGNRVALVGRSAGGQPNTALTFGSADQARAVLIEGPLLDAVLMAFDPSAETAAPLEVIAVRVNPATQASLALLSSASAEVISLKSLIYGARGNRAAVKVEAATAGRGLKLTTQFVDEVYTQDNVFRNAFSVSYSGAAASAQIQVTPTQIVVSAPTGTTVATLDLNEFKTIQEVVDRLNAISNISAQVSDGNGQKAALNGLDNVTAQDIKTAPYTVRADLQAAIDWFNSQAEGLVVATRPDNVGTLPAPLPFTYLAGAVDGNVTNAEWTAAFTTLQSADVQWVVPISGSADIHAMADTHAHFMSSVSGAERRVIVGGELGTADSAALIAAKALNSDRTSYVHLGCYDYGADGILRLQPPYLLAAKIAGAFSGLNPGTPLTNKSLKIRGLERKLRIPTDTDALIRGGVLCVEDSRTGYRVVKSISTWLNDDRYSRVEQSTGVAIDYTARSLREALASIKGAKGSPVTLGLARSQAESALRILSIPEPIGIGVLVGDADNPAWRNLKLKLTGDVVECSVEVQPAIGVNYVAITIHARPYSGSVS